jgi:putative nucleotidyltransferase with HDIG domain
MAGEEDLCIHLLTEAAGDKVSMHAVNVALIALLMGRVFGFGEDDLQDLGVGALLHDVGKLEMPLRLRHADDSFSPAERRDYEEHVAQGLAVARRMGLSAGATLVVAQHHEHADGSGFPLRLNADRMTVAARIVALVNRYDNLCNPYFVANALTPHEALSLLFAQGQSKFDSSILNTFIKMMGVYPPGSTVQLTDDRYALVVGVNSSRPLKPSVLVHEPGIPRDEALVLDLDQAHDLGIRRSIRPVQLPESAHRYLAPRQRVAYFFEPVRVQEPVA